MDWLIPYAAGFFDGEGYVAIRRKSPRAGRNANAHMDYSLEIVASNINPAPLQRLYNRWGGMLTYHKSKKENQRDIYRWTCTTAKALAFLKDVEPYIAVKRQQVDLALAFCQHVEECRRLRYQHGAKGTQAYPAEVSAIRHQFYEDLKRINHRWIRTHGLTSEE